jgi:hypothetical protein
LASSDGLDDLAAVDPLQVDRGDAEIRVSQLSLDDVQRHPLAGHLDHMGVAQLVRREAAPDTGPQRQVPKLRADGRARPRASPCLAFDGTEERADGQPEPYLEPGAQLIPAPLIHPNLTSLAALATANQ